MIISNLKRALLYALFTSFVNFSKSDNLELGLNNHSFFSTSNLKAMPLIRMGSITLFHLDLDEKLLKFQVLYEFGSIVEIDISIKRNCGCYAALYRIFISQKLYVNKYNDEWFTTDSIVYKDINFKVCYYQHP